MKDIWPLADRAFAIAESATLGVKVLEWSEADPTWRYIDDNTQNEPGFGKYAGSIWAPTVDEIYYAVAPGTIYHGKRQAGWSWSRASLEDKSHDGEDAHDTRTDDHGYPRDPILEVNVPALGVWGTSVDDVYAWYSNTIYHYKSDDGGAPAWVAEYTANDHESANEHLFFVSAAGSGPDDLWFAGARASSISGCALIVHKTADGFRRVADAKVSGASCMQRGDALLVFRGRGWVTNLQSAGTGAIVGIEAARFLAQLSETSGTYALELSPMPQMGADFRYTALWRGADEIWLTAWGVVVRTTDVTDAGSYKPSTISLNGAPIDRPLHRIRGTSNTNLWVIGNGYAFHKTTP